MTKSNAANSTSSNSGASRNNDSLLSNITLISSCLASGSDGDDSSTGSSRSHCNRATSTFTASNGSRGMNREELLSVIQSVLAIVDDDDCFDDEGDFDIAGSNMRRFDDQDGAAGGGSGFSSMTAQ